MLNTKCLMLNVDYCYDYIIFYTDHLSSLKAATPILLIRF